MNPVDPPNTRQDFEFIVILRAVAALLVVYSQLMGSWGARYANPGWALIDFIHNYVTYPLGIVGDFATLAVCIFFLISGFIITHTAQHETRLTFAIKRLLRIYPPFIVSIGVIFILTTLLANTTYLSQIQLRASLSPFEALVSTTLLNYLITNPYRVNLVAWTLLVEVMFYGLCVVTLSLIKARPRLAVLVNLGCCFLYMLIYAKLGSWGFHIAVHLMSVPYLIFGQIIYYFWSKRIDWRSFGVLAFLCYVVILYGLHWVDPTFYPAANSAAISFIYALLIFGGLLLVNDQLKAPRIVRFLSVISYSLYLYHYVVGSLLLVILIPTIGYTLALPIAIAASVGVAYLSWRFVEKPSQQVARALIRRFNLAPAESEIPPLPDAPAPIDPVTVGGK